MVACSQIVTVGGFMDTKPYFAVDHQKYVGYKLLFFDIVRVSEMVFWPFVEMAKFSCVLVIITRLVGS